MDRLNLQQHLNRILENIAAIQSETGGMDYEQFVQNEQVKETVYSMLQEVGQIAFEISENNPYRLDIPFDIESLSTFRNARYNQEAELDHHGVWNIVSNELQQLGEQIERSAHYNYSTEQRAAVD